MRGDRVLLGRRRGAHGAGTFAFPGGRPRPGESPADAVKREVREETGLVATTVAGIMWTDEVFPDDGVHYVTLHHRLVVPETAQPELCEPEKCDGWYWYSWSALPSPLFIAAANLVSSGWTPQMSSVEPQVP